MIFVRKEVTIPTKAYRNLSGAGSVILGRFASDFSMVTPQHAAPGASVTMRALSAGCDPAKAAFAWPTDWGTADNFYQQTKRIAPRSS